MNHGFHIERSRTWAVALVLYLVAIFVVSNLTAAQLSVLHIRFWDKAVHFFEYLPVGFLVFGWFHTLFKDKKVFRIVIPAFVSVVLLGCFDELHQFFVPTRDASCWDILADSLGGSLGILLASVFFRIRNRMRMNATS